MKNIFKIDNSTYILVLFGLLSGYIKNIFIIFVIVLIHELGHVFFFYMFNYDIESIVIYPFGGVSKVNKRIHERIYKDVLVSIGGILFQIVLFLLFCLLYRFDMVVKSTFLMFCTYNISVILFNLIPMIPLDGSKLLFSILTKYLPYKLSYILMIIVGVISLVLFVIYNFILRLNDVVIYLFLFLNLMIVMKEYRYFLNKFYLERMLSDNYYDGIVYDSCINDMKLNKYYYFKNGDKLINERDYLVKNRFYNKSS